jgi:hypothetical protein
VTGSVALPPPLNGIRVRGPISPEELAAVVAAMSVRVGDEQLTTYEQWRRTRRAALRRDLAP